MAHQWQRQDSHPVRLVLKPVPYSPKNPGSSVFYPQDHHHTRQILRRHPRTFQGWTTRPLCTPRHAPPTPAHGQKLKCHWTSPDTPINSAFMKCFQYPQTATSPSNKQFLIKPSLARGSTHTALLSHKGHRAACRIQEKVAKLLWGPCT